MIGYNIFLLIFLHKKKYNCFNAKTTHTKKKTKKCYE